MKTQITFKTGQINFAALILFFICFLSSLNSHSQKIETSLTETWNVEDWENFNQTLKTYDGNGYLIHDLRQEWDISWKNKFQTDYTNNPDGTVQQSIFQYWNIGTSQWVNSGWSTYTYNLDGTTQQSILQLWNTGTSQWDNLQKVIYTYNDAKKVLTSESYYWSPALGIWKYSSTIANNTYDENNYLIKYQSTDGSGGIYQITYTNNLDGTVSQELTGSGTVWDSLEIYERITYTYTNSKLTMTLYEYYDFTSDIWFDVYMNTYEFDGSGYLTLYKEWSGEGWIYLTQSYTTNYENGNPFQIVFQGRDAPTSLVWRNLSRTTFTDTSLGVQENIFEKSFAVYPNPTQDKITIKTHGNNLGLNYLVADQLGRKFLNGTINDNETVIDVSQLATGVYFIQMGQNKNQTIKIIKK